MQQETPKKRNKLFPLLNTASYIVSIFGVILFVISLIFSISVIVKEDFYVGAVLLISTLAISLLVIILAVIARLFSKKIEQNQQNQSK